MAIPRTQEHLTETRFTAACIVTLGTVCIGIFGNHDEIEYRLEDYLELFSRYKLISVVL